MKRQLKNWRSSMLLMITALAVMGCAGTNPIAVAETPAQKAYAIERSYNVVLEGALDLVNDPQVPESLKEGIRATERRTTPVIDGLAQAAKNFILAQAEISAGESSADRMVIVSENLEMWIRQAEDALVQLARAVDS